MDDLTIQKNDVVALTQNGGLAEVIKPLKKEIHLFDTYVAGVTHLKDKTVLGEIKEKDRLTLQREDNKYDSKAILILTSGGKKLGYVPERDNVVFSRLMDAGKLLVAYIVEIQKMSDDYSKIKIGIHLVDF